MYLWNMEEGVKKLFKRLIMRKYPMYLDIHVTPYWEGSLRYDNPFNRERYEVILVIHEKDFREEMYGEIDKYVRDIAKYMDVEVMGVYHEVVNDEEWGEMKNN